ncbi:MAG: hypothetical protein ABJL44_02155 [Algibacter sp.]
MKILLFFCFLSMFSCKKEIKNSVDIVKIINNDSIKSSLRDKIIINYLNISITKLSKDNIKYNEYNEFKNLDSLFDAYNDLSLSHKELKYLKFAKAKRYLLTANYDKAISELDILSKIGDLNEYQNLLLGISYKLKGDLIHSNLYFDELLLQVNKVMKSSSSNECSKYLLLNILIGKEKLTLCKDYIKEYKELQLIEIEEIIRIHFLSDIEL